MMLQGQQVVVDVPTAAARVTVAPPRPFLRTFWATVKETLFPDDPFRAGAAGLIFGPAGLVRPKVARPPPIPLYSVLRCLIPCLDWLPSYSLSTLRSDLVSSLTIACLATPQGISYARLAGLDPVIGLYSSFVLAVVTLLFVSMLGIVALPTQKSVLYAALAFTATFFAGAFQAALGVLRLGFLVDFLLHAAIVGFMGGCDVVSLGQLKGFLGLAHSTHTNDAPAIVGSVLSQSGHWHWQPFVLGVCLVVFLQITRYISKKRPKLFWISAAAPLASVVFSTVLVYLINEEKHGIATIGLVKKGISPLSANSLLLSSPHAWLAAKTGILTGIISLAEGSAVAKNYHVDGNKEMSSFGAMNMVGSCTSCYLTAGPFSRSAVNRDAGCRSAASNVVMALAVLATLLFLTPLFQHTAQVVLSAIIASAMMGVLKIHAAVHLWRVDKVDFFVCLGTLLGVVFRSVEVGLIVAVSVLVLRILLSVSRPTALGAPKDHEDHAVDRIDEEDRIKATGGGEASLRCVVLDMGAVASIDSCGTKMVEDLKNSLDKRGLQIALANPGSEIMRKLDISKVLQLIGDPWIFLTVADACDHAQTNCNIGTELHIVASPDEMV
ncbi:hypothetical protein BS78_01G230600 [Paspalum vaginatum]|nr:hypothetical protein BS78_01G230600 [Paspalum vaginatum]